MTGIQNDSDFKCQYLDDYCKTSGIIQNLMILNNFCIFRKRNQEINIQLEPVLQEPKVDKYN